MNIGDSWNEWTVVEFIGEGSFGKVYKIKREEFGYTYYSALKVLRIPQNKAEVTAAKHDGMSEERITVYFQSMVEDIVSEFVLMSQLRGNSNIVSFEDHKVEKLEDDFGWEIYIRMELLTPLFDYLQNNTLTVRDVIKLGIDMCKALEICQKHNIIHRDIKPENIFLSEQGNYKLGDFGIARQLEKTSTGLSKKGTQSYMAPEVYKGQQYNSTVDIYSLGIVLYRFLNNNRMPFFPPYPEEVRYSDKEQANFMRMSGKKMAAPCNAKGRLAEIVMKACAYEPKDRYESAYEMRRALESIAHTREESRIVFPAGVSPDITDRSSKKPAEAARQGGTVSKFELTPEEKAAAERKQREERAQRAAKEKARRETEEKARREAEERARKEAEEKARRAAEEKARREAEERAQKEAEERVRIEAEAKAKREAEERVRKEAEERARREAEEKARREAEERTRIEADKQNKETVKDERRKKSDIKQSVFLWLLGLIMALCFVIGACEGNHHESLTYEIDENVSLNLTDEWTVEDISKYVNQLKEDEDAEAAETLSTFLSEEDDIISEHVIDCDNIPEWLILYCYDASEQTETTDDLEVIRNNCEENDETVSVKDTYVDWVPALDVTSTTDESEVKLHEMFFVVGSKLYKFYYYRNDNGNMDKYIDEVLEGVTINED